jgi:DNA-binding transcriptional ArsR family regulator
MIGLTIGMATTFEVLAEPARRDLLDLLVDGPRPVGELVAASGLSQPNTSRHLRILRDAGLVESRPDGQRRLYELRPEGLAEIERWLAPYRRLWRTSLDALGRHLETDAQEED